MSQQTEDQGMNLPNPAEMAKTYAEVAQRASRVLTQFMEKKAKEGVEAPTDEMGVAKAFMDLSARLMANPYKMAQTQMNMMWDYFSLWQGSMMKMMGMPGAAPVAAPAKGDKRFKDEDWEQHFLFDFVKQSYLIAARHIHDTVSGAEGLDESRPAEVIDANARALKQLAREIGCPVVVLSQFNRAGQLAGRKPRLQDMKGSGGIESHADIVLVLHPAEGRRDGPAPDVVDTDLLILKARACPTTEVHLRFERRFTRFVELGCDAREGAVPDSALDAPEGM